MSPSGSGSVTPTHNGNGHTEAAAAVAAIESPSKLPTKPLRKGPLRKRPRQSLEAMAAAIDKGKKMTTLEKVSLWGCPLANASVADGLEVAYFVGQASCGRAAGEPTVWWISGEAGIP